MTRSPQIRPSPPPQPRQRRAIQDGEARCRYRMVMVKLFMCPDCHDKDSPWLRRELGDHFEVEDFGNFLVVTTNSDIPVLSSVCSCEHVGPVAMLPQVEGPPTTRPRRTPR
jgi:hypothetical protein